jgi:hypothetical protein
MGRNEGDDVVQLLIDTGVLTANAAADIQSVHAEVILHHMKEQKVLLPSEEENVRQVLAVLLGAGPLAKRLEAKIKLVGIITDNVHRRIDQQSVKTREQRERITGEAFPMVARLAKPK